jgi:hypothetical protein
VKVIGKSQDGYLIAATEREIANLFGFYWEGEDKYKAALKEQGVGDHYGGRDLIGLTIKPAEAYQQLSWLRSRDREFDDLCKKLRETADAIQNHKPLFDVIVGDKK